MERDQKAKSSFRPPIRGCASWMILVSSISKMDYLHHHFSNFRNVDGQRLTPSLLEARELKDQSNAFESNFSLIRRVLLDDQYQNFQDKKKKRFLLSNSYSHLKL